MQTNTTLVINWHLTEPCNYRCQYCYAKWDATPTRRELIHDPELSKALLGELYRFFELSNGANPLSGRMRWVKVRLNIAGGEPLLHHRRLPALVLHAQQIGFEVSLITNASRLSEGLIAELAPHLSWLGVSIDSGDAETNRKIGRVDRRGNLLNLATLARVLRQARARHPHLKLKLNTVVNTLNASEDFSRLIRLFAPDKWKVLRMLPVVTDALAVSDREFADFVTRHAKFAEILHSEDNEQMSQSYLMVDPEGRFFQNGTQPDGRGYRYSRAILDVGAAAAFDEISFDPDRFRTRYGRPGVGAR